MHLDLTRWPRREAFAYYRDFDNPFFGITTRVDVAALRSAVRDRGIGSLMLAWHHIVLRLCNQLEPFRWRVDGERVWVHPEIHGSTTVLREDGSFGFALLPLEPRYERFAERSAANIAAARSPQSPFDPGEGGSALIYCTTLPWVHFTSFSHARRWGRGDSVPRFAFGRIDAEGDRQWMPVAIDVHHGLMDGVHVGEFVQRFEAALREPHEWLA